MTVYTLKCGFPQIPLEPGMQLRLEAVSPTTGAAVGGVTSSRWAIYGDVASAGELELGTGDPEWVWQDEPAPEPA